MMSDPNYSFNISQIQQIQQIQQVQPFNYNDKQALNMIKRANNNFKAGNVLIQRADEKQQNGNIEDSQALYTEAGSQYGRVIEKYQKAAVAASGGVRDKLSNGKKVLMSHNNTDISKYLSKKDAEIISREDAKIVDKIHISGKPANSHASKNSGLSYIAFEYGEVVLDKEQCDVMKSIATKAQNNYQKRVDVAKSKLPTIVERVDRMIAEGNA